MVADINSDLKTKVDLFDIDREENVKNSNLLVLPIPTSDSTATEVLDLMGVTQNIDINGITSFPDDVANLTALKQWVTDLQDFSAGDQTTDAKDIVYTSDFYGAVNVKVQDVRIEIKKAVPNAVFWSLKLIVTKAE